MSQQDSYRTVLDDVLHALKDVGWFSEPRPPDCLAKMHELEHQEKNIGGEYLRVFQELTPDGVR